MIELVTCILLALGVGPGGDDEVTGSVTITLGMEATVFGTEVELGEIGQIVGSDAAVVKLVKAVELGYAPSPGYSRVFRRDQIASALGRKLPGVSASFLGQVAIRVRPEVERISGETILAAARTQIQTALLGQEVTFQSSGDVLGVEVPAGSGAHEIHARLEEIPQSSKVISVPVDIHVDGARYRTVWTSWQVEVWETRPVLARAVRAGEILSNAMFERRRVKRAAGENAQLDAGLLQGSVALRDLAPGATVTALDVQRPTVVVAGQTVFLRVRKGAIEARVSAVAMQSGSIGDRIRVVTSEGSQELVAAIHSRDTCLIDLGGPIR